MSVRLAFGPLYYGLEIARGRRLILWLGWMNPRLRHLKELGW